MIKILDGQHGAYSFRNARSMLGDSQLRAAVESGRLVGFGRGVLLDAERILDLRTRCAGALLLTGGVGVIAGPSAAALHGCTAVGGFPVHVLVPYAHRIRSRPGLIVHQGDLSPDDVTTLDAMRVLALDLTLAEVLCTAPRRAALACVDQALRGLRQEDKDDLVAQVKQRLTRRTDRRGTRRAAALLGLATGLPETPIQSAFVLLLADSALPPPICQYPVRDNSGRIRRVDFAWPDAKVALECGARGAIRSNKKWQQLKNQGWTVIRADEQDLTDATTLCRRLRSALRPRRKKAA
jgi:hypothetical protein